MAANAKDFWITEQKAVTDIFDIRFIGTECISEEVRKETKQQISSAWRV